MFKITQVAFFLSVFLSSLQALSCAGVELGGEFLYLVPCSDEAPYALVDEEYVKNSEKFTPAWRGYLVIPDVLHNWDLMGSFTRVDLCRTSSVSRDTESILSTLAFGPFVDAAYSSVSSKDKSIFSYWDALIAYSCCCGNFTFKPFFGAAGLYLEKERTINHTSSQNTLDIFWRSALWAAGAKYGATSVFKIGERIYLYGSGAGILLTGESRKGVNRQNDGSTFVEARNRDRCSFSPGYQLSAGINIAIDCIGEAAGIHVGWEMLKISNIPGPARYMSDQFSTSAPLSTSRSEGRYGYQGLVVGGDILF